MLRKNGPRQIKMTFVTLEDIMPKTHFLRDLDRFVSFDFIYEKVSDLYSSTGRPSVDPVLLIKMLLIGYIYGIDSERKLEREITVNIAYRWFLGIDLDENVPDHSTISQLRRRKFDGTTIFQDIFDEVVRRCIKTGLIGGKLLMTDSTHIRANARNDLREIIEIADTPSEYMKKLDNEAYEMGLIKEPVKYKNSKKKKVIKSITDPECGLMKRAGKPIGFYYLNHQTCDSKNGIITDVFVTAGNSTDHAVHVKRLEYQIGKFNLTPDAICADGGYDSREVYHAMMHLGIKTYIPSRNKPISRCNYTEEYTPKHFKYDSNHDQYVCPMGNNLKYTSYLKGKGYKRYIAKQSNCQKCPCKEQCIGKSQIGRGIERHLHENAKTMQMKFNSTPEYYDAMKLRKIWCEGNFSHQKECHNLKRTRKRGIERLAEQCLLSACALNLKRLVKHIRNKFFTNQLFLSISPAN